jgi:hypothetical protein
MGRYTIQRNTSAEIIGKIAANKFMPRASQYMLWNTKKVFKKVGGQGYLKVRKWILSRNEKG